jgi:adenine deaminase
MAFAANILSDMNGGLVAVESGHILAKLALPIAGLMSDRPADEVSTRLESLEASAKKLGAKISKPFSALSFLSLVVIPELRVTDKGLVDVCANRLTSLFA